MNRISHGSDAPSSSHKIFIERRRTRKSCLAQGYRNSVSAGPYATDTWKTISSEVEEVVNTNVLPKKLHSSNGCFEMQFFSDLLRAKRDNKNIWLITRCNRLMFITFIYYSCTSETFFAAIEHGVLTGRECAKRFLEFHLKSERRYDNPCFCERFCMLESKHAVKRSSFWKIFGGGVYPMGRTRWKSSWEEGRVISPFRLTRIVLAIRQNVSLSTFLTT